VSNIPKRLTGDQTRLRQKRLNAVGNAVKVIERNGMAMTITPCMPRMTAGAGGHPRLCFDLLGFTIYWGKSLKGN
jgi:hypothetical protein